MESLIIEQKNNLIDAFIQSHEELPKIEINASLFYNCKSDGIVLNDELESIKIILNANKKKFKICNLETKINEEKGLFTINEVFIK